MCTAFSSFGLFGRTLDFEHSFGEKFVFVPRRAGLNFLLGVSESHFSFMGLGIAERGFPLLFDGVNEQGVFVAALNFPKSAYYTESRGAGQEIASFEVVPLVLSKCKSAADGAALLGESRIVNNSFLDKMSPSPLHWFIADNDACFTIEATISGTAVYENRIGVLTNEPSFPYQLEYLSGFSELCAQPHTGGFTERLGLTPHSRGVGAIGLPGDFSSPSRFVRAAFALHNTDAEDSQERKLAHFFRIASTVSIPRGLVKTDKGESVYTVYTSCAAKGGYAYTTYYDLALREKSFSEFEPDEEEIFISEM